MNKKDEKPIEKTIVPESKSQQMTIDDIFIQDPEGYAAKFKPDARKMIVEYLNSRPMAQVEIFFQEMFDIPEKDPFFTIKWVKMLFDYLKNTCPRGEARNVIIRLANGTVLYKMTKKEEPAGKEEPKENENKDGQESSDKPEEDAK